MKIDQTKQHMWTDACTREFVLLSLRPSVGHFCGIPHTYAMAYLCTYASLPSSSLTLVAATSAWSVGRCLGYFVSNCNPNCEAVVARREIHFINFDFVCVRFFFHFFIFLLIHVRQIDLVFEARSSTCQFNRGIFSP